MRLRLTLLAALALLLALSAAPAAAHVELVDADPGVDDVVAEGVTRVTLRLAGLDPDRPVEVEVTDGAGNDVTAGTVEVDALTSTAMVPTQRLQPGQHRVQWRAWSDDGDGVMEGTFAFTVREAVGGGWGTWMVWFVALAIPAAILLRPRRRSRT